MECVFDSEGKNLETLDPIEIPHQTTNAILSNNHFTVLPENLFNETPRIWKIDLKHNYLRDLAFMQSIKALGRLDISYNDLEVDELLQIRHIYMVFLYCTGNGFQHYFSPHPLTMLCLLKRVWIIDGNFITDYARKMAKEFKGTLTFGETVLAARRDKPSELKSMGTTQMTQAFLSGTSCKFTSPGLYISPTGTFIQNLTKRPQIEKFKYLLSQYPITLPPGTFIDYFSLALGVLANHWLDLPVAHIPRLLSRAYWGSVSAVVTQYENWYQWLLLMKISEIIKSDKAVEQELWKALRINSYLQTGAPPLLGSVPRMIISALLYRAVDPEEVENSPDITVYTKYREMCGFTSLDEDLNVIHSEILGSFPVPDKPPVKGETMAIIHPLTEKWTNCTISQVKDGKVIGELPDVVLQMPISALFWDGRGVWRQTKRRSSGIIKRSAQRSKSAMVPRLSEEARKAFITASATMQQQMADAVNHTFSEQTFQSTHIPSSLVTNKRIRVAPPDNSDQLKKSLLSTGKPLTMTQEFKTTAPPVQYLPSTFRGIVDPKLPQRHTIPRVAPTRRTNQVVEGVVNITLGQEIEYGKRLRKFHVRVRNELTKRLSYVWINEDEIPPDDVRRLCELYKAHIESKMLVIKEKKPLINHLTIL